MGEVVETKCGAIRGIKGKSRDGREFWEWRGIPYAKPPVGDLRFADSLFLNVAAPKLDGHHNHKKLAVMVFIHGGAFQMGSSQQYPPHYFMDEDVVFVSLNYRLGLFGFLNTGDNVIRGNMGLKDQALAIRWVKHNIESFGGDPENITIFGESAGGASVHYQCLSPSTKGLFQKAISQSGAASPSVSFGTAAAKELARKFAGNFNCDPHDSHDIARCLRSKSTKELMNAYKPVVNSNHLFKPHLDGHCFRPSAEAVDDKEAFLTEYPYDMIRRGKAHAIPWLTGANADEGLISSLNFYKNPKNLKEYESNWSTSVFRSFGVPPHIHNAGEIAEKLREFYFHQDMNEAEKLHAFTRLFSDSYFYYCMNEAVKLQRSFSPVYLYYFTRRGGPSLTKVLEHNQKKYPPILEVIHTGLSLMANKLFKVKFRDYGVCHGDDLALFFPIPFVFDIKKNPDDPDYTFSRDTVKLWVQFAHDETSMNFRGVHLSPQKPTGHLHYLALTDEPKVIGDPLRHHMEFLESLHFLGHSKGESSAHKVEGLHKEGPAKIVGGGSSGGLAHKGHATPKNISPTQSKAGSAQKGHTIPKGGSASVHKGHITPKGGSGSGSGHKGHTMPKMGSGSGHKVNASSKEGLRHKVGGGKTEAGKK